MVCKEEVVRWFKGQQSFQRIDTMCTMLSMCLPFELRFLGTVLEELGGRDSNDLRGVEKRVNNTNDFAQEIASSQLDDPTDMKARRKMALYFALIRACSRPCVNELFNILYTWGNNEFLKHASGDALQELLLVFMMATYHPVFSIEQRVRCGEIYNRIMFGKREEVFEMGMATAVTSTTTTTAAATTTTATAATTVDGAQNEWNLAAQGVVSEENPSTSNVSQAGSQVG